MKEELGYIGKRIIENKEVLASKMIDLQDKSYPEVLKQAGLTFKEMKEYQSQFIQLLGESLFTETGVIAPKVHDWSIDIGGLAIQRGIPLEKLIKTITLLRTVIWDSFSEELSQQKFAAITMLDVSLITNPIIDDVFFTISQMYAEDNEQRIRSAYDTLQQLSVPVVPLAEDIAILPLIGEIDTYRAKTIMETSLQQSTELGLEYLIIDVSGVPIVDTVVAHSLFQVVDALKLIGVDTTFTGIRPEIAQTVVSLGVHFKGIKTLANLHQALAEIGFVRQ